MEDFSSSDYTITGNYENPYEGITLHPQLQSNSRMYTPLNNALFNNASSQMKCQIPEQMQVPMQMPVPMQMHNQMPVHTQMYHQMPMQMSMPMQGLPMPMQGLPTPSLQTCLLIILIVVLVCLTLMVGRGVNKIIEVLSVKS